MQKGLLFLLSLLLILPIPAHAQTQTLGDGCDREIIDVIAATTDTIDYHAGCAQYSRCNNYSDGDINCQFLAFSVMLEQCPLDDSRCRDGAILLAAAIFAFEDSGDSPPQSVIDAVPRALEAFWNGDDAGALAAYQVEVDEEDYYFQSNASLPLSRAVLYRRLGQYDQALEEYSSAVGGYFVYPLLSYIASQIYADLGRRDEASFEIAMIASSIFTNHPEFADDPDLPAFIADLQAQYPLDESVMQEWLYYPVSDANGGPGGLFVSDNSLVPPRPVRLGMFDELNAVVAIGLKNWSASGFNDPDPLLQVMRQNENGIYVLNYPQIYEGSGSMALVPTEFGYHGQERITFFEGSGDWRFMLAPAGSPDPRTSLADTRYCAGSVISRLEIGAVVTSISYASQYGLSFANTPGGDILNSYTADTRPLVTVLDGPQCVDNVTWWQGISSTGDLGWFPENLETTYLASPTQIREGELLCNGIPPALPTRLSVDTSASVVPDLGPNNIRAYPSSDGDLLGGIPPLATFEIIGGPACVDGLVWWYVEYQGMSGWTAEGADGVYWLAPLG